MTSAAFGPEWLSARLAELVPAFPDVSLCVALSGGVDSVTLLAALAALRGARASSSPVSRGSRAKRASQPGASTDIAAGAARAGVLQLRAVHVHHGLHANADAWAAHCEALTKKLRVPLSVLRVKVDRAQGASLEAAARDARYEALAKVLQHGEVLLTAHHQDDQLETIFLQLLRGAGVAGLAAMPAVAPFACGQLVRPLLTCSRAELEEWARARELAWVDDDSNSDEQLHRNYLRRTVLPLIRKRWPGAGAAVSRSARHAAEARRLLDALAQADVERASIGR